MSADTIVMPHASEPSSPSEDRDPRIRVVPGRSGRWRSEGERDVDRVLLVCSHLWLLVGFLTATLPLVWIGPIVVWAVRKDQSPLVDDQGREIINTMLTMLVLLVSTITVIALPFVLIWLVVWFIGCVRGAIAAGNGEYFRYPMTIRFIS